MKYLIFVLLLATGCRDWNKDTTQVDYYQYIDTAYYEHSYEAEELADIPTEGKKTKYINIHCTASKEGVNLKASWFLKFFKEERKWSKPGYNFIIELDGNIEETVPVNFDGYTTWSEVSYGVAGKNSVSINIAYVGGVDKNLKAKDTRTIQQKAALKKLVQNLLCNMPDVIVFGHRDHPRVYKDCPSFEVGIEYGNINTSELFDLSTDTTGITR